MTADPMTARLVRLARLEIMVAELRAIVDRIVYAAERDDENLIVEARALAKIAAERGANWDAK